MLLTMLGALLAPVWGCGASDAPEDPSEMKMLVLGMDGMDPILLRKLLAEGKMPHFQKVINAGTFNELTTSMPPQSPVAWSNFISGANPDTHMIWDFIHRRPKPDPKVTNLPILPYQSTGDVIPIDVPWYKSPFPEFLPWFGGSQLPLYSTHAPVSSRKGPAFWEGLVTAGIDTTLYRVPATYPPPVDVAGHGHFRCLCGMGTPDFNGSYGEFTEFRSDITKDKSVSGGRLVRLNLKNGVAESMLQGPPNPFRVEHEGEEAQHFESPVRFSVDPESKTVGITAGDETLVLKEGEWSKWIQLTFDAEVPLTFGAFSPNALVRFRAISVYPELNVYASPLQLDPTKPADAISTPSDFAEDIAKATGLFYTAGIPEDTKALRSKPQALTEDQFLEMVHNLAAERHEQYKYALSQFKRGFLFFYFGHTDQLAHIFWRDIDPGHPGRLPEQDGLYDHVIEDAYIEMDERVAEALKVLDDNDVLLIMSDHGFASFRRGFNVNTWLEENGYQVWKGTSAAHRRAGLLNIDFSKSQAYALGINGLYINLQDREGTGIVPQSEYTSLLHEIGDKLLQVRDDDGTQVIVRNYYVQEEYPKADKDVAPDMLIGYARNYRGSWATALGGMVADVLEDNMDRWSGDHCIAHTLVPGIIVTNLKLSVDDPALSDLAPSILHEFGQEPLDGMIGRSIFEGGPHPVAR